MRMTGDGCTVIAEAGVNHNGSLDIACQLATAALESGADYVKYQTFVPSLVATSVAPVTPYQSNAGFLDQRSMLSEFVLSQKEHRTLKKHCDDIGIGFSSTGHDIDSVHYLEKLGQDFVKVGSGDLTNWQLLEEVAKFRKPLIVSTGASTWDDVYAAVNFLESLEVPVQDNLILLQCTSAYPAPSEEANIKVLSGFRSEFGCRVGYSDHTRSVEAALAAVSLGACVLEKHITLDTTMAGPDHNSSLDAFGFREYVQSVRRLESTLGAGEKFVTPSEVENQRLIRKGLYARTPIAAGQEFSRENVIAKRPLTTTPASMWPEVNGRVARRNYSIDEPIEV